MKEYKPTRKALNKARKLVEPVDNWMVPHGR
jgi:hypothetical protein